MSETLAAGVITEYDLFTTGEGDWLLVVEPGSRAISRNEVNEAVITVAVDGLRLSRDGRDIRLAPASSDAMEALAGEVGSVVVVEMVLGRRAAFYAAQVRPLGSGDAARGSDR